MSDGDGGVDVDLAAEEFTLHASEKVSTGQYESATASMTVEGSIEGADLTDGFPPALRERLYERQRALQDAVKTAAEQRRAESEEDDGDERTHEV